MQVGNLIWELRVTHGLIKHTPLKIYFIVWKREKQKHCMYPLCGTVIGVENRLFFFWDNQIF